MNHCGHRGSPCGVAVELEISRESPAIAKDLKKPPPRCSVVLGKISGQRLVSFRQERNGPTKSPRWRVDLETYKLV